MGIINQAMQQPDQNVTDPGPPDSQTSQQTPPVASPRPIVLNDQQATLEGRKVVAMATQKLHASHQVYDSIVKLLSVKGVRPEQLIANGSVYLVQYIDSLARKAGEEIDDRAHIYSAVGICHEVYSVAQREGLFTVKPNQMQLAVTLSIQQYLKAEIAAGRIDKAQLAKDFASGVDKMTPAQKVELNNQLLAINRTAVGARRSRSRKRNKFSVGRA